MPKALILVADGSEEIEFVTPYDVLTRAGLEIHSAGINLKNENYAHLTRNIRIVPDHATLSSVRSPETYDVLILPGGGPGAKTFSTSNEVLQLITSFRQQGKYVTAICAGTTALVAAQKLAAGSKTESDAGRKVRVTSHPSVKDEIKEAGWVYSEERVVVDGKVVTSRGPGTAMLFALTIVELLAGKEKRDEISGPLMIAETL
ncbi:DJ-1 [Lizonia empirigonia]|nr:DJ-1 [Lizonia empirigonia]